MKKNFRVEQFTAGSCYSYILTSEGEALLVDPHISLKEEYYDHMEKNSLSLKYVVDTHTHADHFSLAAVFKKEFGIPVLMHEKAVSQVASARLVEDDEISIGEIGIKVLYTPGHTDDAIGLYAEGRLFTGDVLLIGSVGRTDFQNGSPESMFDTLKKIKEFPDDTIILPAHDYNGKKSSTLAKEKSSNPFLKQENKDDFVRDMKEKALPEPFNIENIIRLNQKGEAVDLEGVSPEEARALIEKDPGTELLDVRSAFEYDEMHIARSRNIPLDSLKTKAAGLAKENKKFIVLCRTGNRSAMAADMLIETGLAGVKILSGGITRWQKEGLSLEKGRGGISLERQIRAIAGTLVFFGTFLGVFLSQWFFIIPAFVSIGLIYAGITDNCMMATLLMKLPYNKKLYKVEPSGGTCAMG